MSEAIGGKSPKPLGIGIAGLGTVGGGVMKLLAEHGDLLAQRTGGLRLEVRGISARDRRIDRGFDISPFPWFDNPLDMAEQDDIDVIVELIGGSDGIAKALVETALANGKHVVTANKALLAHHGASLAASAEQRGLALSFEASVAGGIPVIKGLRDGMAANEITRIVAVLNGTCNFVLGMMEDEECAFDDAVREAQEQGFAEADPTTDIGGFDAAHKLAILASIAYGTQVDINNVRIEGIEHVSIQDIMFARELGYRIKLLAVASRSNGEVVQRVQPSLVPLEHPLAHVSGPGNAIHIEGDPVGGLEFGGLGAGEGPTASAVVADIMDIARGLRLPAFGRPASSLAEARPSGGEDEEAAFYLRLMVANRPGAMAELTRALADQGISIETMIQRPEEDHEESEAMPVVIVTYLARDAAMRQAIAAIEADGILRVPPHLIRVEPLSGAAGAA